MSIMNFCPPNLGSTVNKNHIYQFHIRQDSFNQCVGLDANTDCNEKYWKVNLIADSIKLYF